MSPRGFLLRAVLIGGGAVLVWWLLLPLAHADPIEEMRHPVTGTAGVWLDAPAYVECRADHAELARVRPVLAEVPDLRLTLRTLSATIASQGARIGELVAENGELRSALPGWAWMAVGGSGLLVLGAVVSVVLVLAQ